MSFSVMAGRSSERPMPGHPRGSACKDGYMIYNDAYSYFAGGRHPQLLGSETSSLEIGALDGPELRLPGQGDHQENAGGRHEKSGRQPRRLRNLAPNQATGGYRSEDHGQENPEPPCSSRNRQAKQRRDAKTDEHDRPRRAGEDGRAHRE